MGSPCLHRRWCRRCARRCGSLRGSWDATDGRSNDRQGLRLRLRGLHDGRTIRGSCQLRSCALPCRRSVGKSLHHRVAYRLRLRSRGPWCAQLGQHCAVGKTSKLARFERHNLVRRAHNGVTDGMLFSHELASPSPEESLGLYGPAPCRTVEPTFGSIRVWRAVAPHSPTLVGDTRFPGYFLSPRRTRVQILTSNVDPRGSCVRKFRCTGQQTLLKRESERPLGRSFRIPTGECRGV